MNKHNTYLDNLGRKENNYWGTVNFSMTVIKSWPWIQMSANVTPWTYVYSKVCHIT